MTKTSGAADEVLAHSQDEGEWEDQAEEIEARPSGKQVISARLPAVLAEELLAEAHRRGVRPSELVRVAVEAMLHSRPGGVAAMTASMDGKMSVKFLDDYRTENGNTVVQPQELVAEPPEIVAL